MLADILLWKYKKKLQVLNSSYCPLSWTTSRLSVILPSSYAPLISYIINKNVLDSQFSLSSPPSSRLLLSMIDRTKLYSSTHRTYLCPECVLHFYILSSFYQNVLLFFIFQCFFFSLQQVFTRKT